MKQYFSELYTGTKSLVEGLGVTMKALFQPIVTVQYPREEIDITPNFRGDIDLILNQRVTIGCFPWRFVGGESSICRIAAFVDPAEYEELMKKKESMRLTTYGDCVPG